jgi:dTDP-4-amino-4,6-dideoxygalactose transaminase
VNVPFFGTEREWAAHGAQLLPGVEAALASGRWLGGDAVAAFEQALASRCARRHAVAVGSGTDALFFVLRALGLGPGDEVLVPDLSFVATASAIVRVAAAPVWVDVDEHGILDLEAAAAAVSPRTAAVVAVSLFGRPLDAEAVEGFAARHGLVLVEDAAQALGASAHGRPAGSVGIAGCLSFDPTKPVSAPGSGGAIVTDDEPLASACRALRLHGRDAAGAFSRLGYNSQLTTLAAAVLRRKLDLEPRWRARRQAIAASWSAAFADVDGLVAPSQAPGTEHAFSKYVVRLAGGRDAVRAALADDGVPALVHYPLALHAHPLFAPWPAGDEPPRALELSRSVLSLPMHPFLTDAEAEHVADAVRRAAMQAAVETSGSCKVARRSASLSQGP